MTDLTDYITSEYRRLLAYARSLTHNRDAADDLVQETCARALAHTSQYRANTSPAAWLFTIMRNLHVSTVRDDTRHRASLKKNWHAADIQESRPSSTPST